MKPTNKVTTLSSESIEMLRSSLSAHGMSTNSIKGYLTDLKMFLLDLEETEVPITDLEETGMNWLTANRNRVAPKTTARRLSALRKFATWAGYPGMFRAYNLPTPARPQPHPLPEGIEGIHRLIEVTRNEQQKALVALCGYCGLRVSEALSVTYENFDLTRMLLTVRGKGDKTRVVPVSNSLAWPALSMSVASSMVESRPVVGFKDRFARRLITDLGERAQLRRHVASHDLRATFATEVYNRTLDIRLVQELLGHSSVETTQLYTGIEMNKLRAAVEGLA